MTRRRWTLTIGIGLLVGVAGLIAWRTHLAPELPPIHVEGADPELIAAIEDARLGVIAEPFSAQTWGKLGLFLAANDYHEPAVTCFRHAAEFSPDNAKWPCLLALELLQTGRSVDALPLLIRSSELARKPDERSALLFWVARLQIELGKLDDADESLNQLRAIERESSRLDYALGILALARGDRNQGATHLKKVANDPSTRRRVCEILASQVGEGDYAICARLPFDQPWPNPLLNDLAIYKVRPRDPLDQFRTLEQQGRKDEAIAILKQLASESPTAEVRYLLGVRYIDSGEFREAIVQLRAAVSLDPRFAKAHQMLGVALLGMGESQSKSKDGEKRSTDMFEEAIRAEDRALSLQVNLALGHTIRGRALKKLGRTLEAIQAFREAIICQPESSELHWELGETLANFGQIEEGIRHLEDAAKLAAPGDNRARDSLSKWRDKKNE